MIAAAKFLEYALRNKLDITYNQGSKYFNSIHTRIDYYKFKGEI